MPQDWLTAYQLAPDGLVTVGRHFLDDPSQLSGDLSTLSTKLTAALTRARATGQ